nr:helix-turn-helix domain-containing protein [Aeromonas veronii]
MEQDGSSDIRVRALKCPESVYTQAGISVHFRPEYARVTSANIIYRTMTEFDREEAGKWLAAQPWVLSYQVAPLSDAWYGPWKDESTTVLSDTYQKETPMSGDKIYFPNEVIGLQFVQGLSLLAAWRNYRGLSQIDLAERVDISLSELVAMEQPDYQFTHQQLVLLADALGIQYEHLTD